MAARGCKNWGNGRWGDAGLRQLRGVGVLGFALSEEVPKDFALGLGLLGRRLKDWLSRDGDRSG